MTQRATVRAGDLNRLLKAAKAHGFAVEIVGDTVRLLPVTGQEPPYADDEKAEAEWDKALGLR